MWQIWGLFYGGFSTQKINPRATRFRARSRPFSAQTEVLLCMVWFLSYGVISVLLLSATAAAFFRSRVSYSVVWSLVRVFNTYLIIFRLYFQARNGLWWLRLIFNRFNCVYNRATINPQIRVCLLWVNRDCTSDIVIRADSWHPQV
jgi:hypothetical protein